MMDSCDYRAVADMARVTLTPGGSMGNESGG